MAFRAASQEPSTLRQLHSHADRAGCSAVCTGIRAHLPRRGLVLLGLRVVAIAVVAAIVVLLRAVLPRLARRQMLPAEVFISLGVDIDLV